MSFTDTYHMPHEYEIKDNFGLGLDAIQAQLNLYGRTGWRLAFIAHGDRYVYERVA